MSDNKKAISFWNFLTENTIEIPIIQRDYAQGRLGKENLRKNFLSDLKKALDSNSDKPMVLDFVYGSTENDKLNPLDGQQRLTTLWLLCWYIALQAGKLNEENCNIFKKFTYEIRISSREFCHNLCEYKHFENFDGEDIVGFITKQTWFYSAWKQDPTIQAMLRMLGGTKLIEADGLEKLLSTIGKEQYCKYWEKLISENAPIQFYHLPLKDFGLTDDLYIKMNARGKQLTSFENFKADLIGYITKQAEDNPESEWKNFLDAENGIPIKLDTDWTDIFWKHKSKENKIDEIYFAFLNRFFLCELICQKTEEKEEYKLKADDLEKNGTFSYLYGKTGDDSQTEYNGDFEKYKYDYQDNKEKRNIPKRLFESLINVLDGCSNADIRICFPKWVESDFQFIPIYKDDNKITTLTQSERVVFHAISKYMQIGRFEEDSFKQWMRVVWNIVENANINSISAMIGAMRLIDELSEYSHDIYTFLSNHQLQIKSDFSKEQVAEEIDKAKQILYGTSRSDGKSWEEIIIEAEKYAFFKGAIRFLFTDGEGKTNWTDFDTKWGNAIEYFDSNGNGVIEEYKIQLTKALVIQCDDWNKQLYDKQIFNPNANTWKWILTAKNWIIPVHNILRASNINNDIVATNEMNDDDIKAAITPVLKDLPFEWIIKNIPESHFFWYKGNRLGIYVGYHPNRENSIFFDWSNFHRNKILRLLLGKKDFSLCDDASYRENSGLFSGLDIIFKFKGSAFRYDYTDYVGLWDYERNQNITKDDKWISFGVKWDLPDEESNLKRFEDQLDDLITQASDENKET